MARAKKIALRVLPAIMALPIVIITLFIVFEVFGAAVNHAAGNRQTSRLADLAEEKGFEIVGTDTFVGNSGNGNHVDLISSVYVRADRTADDAKAALGSNEDGLTVCVPNSDELSDAGISVPAEELLKLRLFNSAPFADNIEGH